VESSQCLQAPADRPGVQYLPRSRLNPIKLAPCSATNLHRYTASN
jgi:hypothetical protein